MEGVIQVKDFRKTYGGFVAVDSIGFEVHRSEIFGLLGPNGAGKTTTLECLEGLVHPITARCVWRESTQRASRANCAT